ncbi:MAG: DMT family transporter [Pirellulales bacterium]|nr:DMT family transporter [Pirellulales bacterium]
MKRLALSALLLSIVAVWGWTFVVVKDAVNAYGVVPFLAIRFLIGSLAIGLFAARHLTRRSLLVGGLIGFALASAYLFQTFGVHLTTATNAGLITGLFIVFAPLANRVLFGVRTAALQWTAIAVSLAGLGMLSISEDGSGQQRLGDALTLGCAACFGLHIALLDRHAHRHRASALAFGQLSSATAVFFVIWAALGAQSPADYAVAWPSGQVWFAFAVTGLIATAAGFFVQTFVQQRLSAVKTAVIIVTEPLFAALFGYLLHGDRLNATQIAGAVLMIFAVIVAELYPRCRNTS